MMYRFDIFILGKLLNDSQFSNFSRYLLMEEKLWGTELPVRHLALLISKSRQYFLAVSAAITGINVVLAGLVINTVPEVTETLAGLLLFMPGTVGILTLAVMFLRSAGTEIPVPFFTAAGAASTRTLKKLWRTIPATTLARANEFNGHGEPLRALPMLKSVVDEALKDEDPEVLEVFNSLLDESPSKTIEEVLITSRSL